MINDNIAIQVKNVTKVYKLFKKDSERLKYKMFHSKKVKFTEKRALDNVSFDIHKGEAVALLGKNGAGKSTLLKMITGVAYPTFGTVRVNGNVSALLELTTGFDPEITGRENIYLKGGILGIDDAKIKELEPEIVEFAELGDYIDQPVKKYSSGMKARLGFAVNINLKPDVLIVDEALSVGDKVFRMKCKDKIASMIEKGVTFLFVTHSQSEAILFCKRGIVMRNGHMVFDGPIKEAAKYYQNMTTGKPAIISKEVTSYE
ncbi:MAG: ABC transporter ATP-binding protein [Clostridia bacterium]|nr:ABC transporter ATP-binding protein [Clostridia bacterium]